MARIRTIKPEFWEDTKIGRITRDARLILIFLWYSSDNDNKSNYTLDFVKKGANLHRYGKIIHEKVIQELSDNGLVEILDSKYLKLIPRNILGIRRSDRFDIQDWGEWKKISEIVFKRDNYTCFYCGRSDCKMEIDHLLPVSRGGSDNISNLVTSCRRCNAQKHDKTLDEFLEWRKCNER
ncbi:HNH endonuclease [Bacteroides fragilis]|uniref:HNH endonuclease n=1 Tax=Bacteroides fragilis TaxID=817 RepID=UPI0039B37578